MLERLTFARLIAALIVVLFHFSSQLLPGFGGTRVAQILSGPVAVSFFYTLSGFIMAYVYGGLGPRGAKSYWIARIARIYPVYILAIFISANMLGWTEFPLSLNISMTQAFVPGQALSINPPGWSISVEAFFYLALPFVMPGVRALGPKRFAWLAIGTWFLGQIWTTFLFANAYDPFPSPAHDFLFYFPLHHFPTFLVGLAAGALVRQESWCLTRRQAQAGLAASLGAYVATVLWLPALAARLGVFIPLPAGSLAPVFAAICVSLFYLPSRWTTTRFAIFAGEASFSLYLLQIPIMIMIPAKVLAFIDIGSTPAAWIGFVSLIAISAFVFRFVETPLRRMIRKAGHVRNHPAAHVA